MLVVRSSTCGRGQAHAALFNRPISGTAALKCNKGWTLDVPARSSCTHNWPDPAAGRPVGLFSRIDGAESLVLPRSAIVFDSRGFPLAQMPAVPQACAASSALRSAAAATPGRAAATG